MNELVRPGLCYSIKKEIPKIKQQLRKKITKFTLNQFKRTQEPLYKIIVNELYGEGYSKTAFFIDYLLNKDKLIDNKTININEQLVVIKLKNSPIIIDEIVKSFKLVEQSIENELYKDGVQELLHLAKELAKKISDYHWIAEEVFIYTLKQANTIDNKELLASTLYWYGNFLASLQNYEKANENYAKAKLLCEKKKWTISIENKVILLKIAISLKYYKTLLNYAKQLMDKEIKNKPIDLCKLGIDIAISSNNNTSIAEAFWLSGKLCMRMKSFKLALHFLQKSLPYFQMERNEQNVCNVKLDIAECYKEMNLYVEAIKHITQVKNIAAKNNLKLELALSYVNLAFIDKLNGNLPSAGIKFINAIEIYDELNMINDIRHSRCLAAICLANELSLVFVSTKLKSDKQKFGNNKYIEQLIDWKDLRKPFWLQQIDDDTNDNTDGCVYVSSTDTDFELKDIDGDDNDLNLKYKRKQKKKPQPINEIKNYYTESSKLSLQPIDNMFEHFYDSIKCLGKFRELRLKSIRKSNAITRYS